MPLSSLPGANPPPPEHLCPPPEHKIVVFVRFYPSEPQFSGFPSTKSRFLCFFGLRNPCFQAFRAQNRGFCVRMGSFSQVLGLPEHKIGFFVRLRTHRQPGAGIWERLDSYPLLIAPLKKHTPEDGLAWRKEGCF